MTNHPLYYISLLSDDQNRNTNVNDKDHLVGQLTILRGAPGKMEMKWASMITQDGQCHLMWHEMVLGRGGPT